MSNKKQSKKKSLTRKQYAKRKARNRKKIEEVLPVDKAFELESKVGSLTKDDIFKIMSNEHIEDKANEVGCVDERKRKLPITLVFWGVVFLHIVEDHLLNIPNMLIFLSKALGLSKVICTGQAFSKKVREIPYEFFRSIYYEYLLYYKCLFETSEYKFLKGIVDFFLVDSTEVD